MNKKINPDLTINFMFDEKEIINLFEKYNGIELNLFTAQTLVKYIAQYGVDSLLDQLGQIIVKDTDN